MTLDVREVLAIFEDAPKDIRQQDELFSSMLGKFPSENCKPHSTVRRKARGYRAVSVRRACLCHECRIANDIPRNGFAAVVTLWKVKPAVKEN